MKIFFGQFCVSLPPLLNIFSSVKSLPFLTFIVPIFAWNVLLVSLIFLKRYLILPILLFPLFPSIDHWGRLSYFSLAIVWNSAFKWIYLSFSPLPLAYLLSLAVCKASSDNYFSFLHFFFLGMLLITASCTMSWTSMHGSSSTLSDLIPWIYLSLPLYNCKGFDVGHMWMV